MTTSYLCLITGQFFRPPAKQVLAALEAAAPLELAPEPDNPYDSNAIKVMWDPEELDGWAASRLQALDAELLNCGMTIEMLRSGGLLQLGYIAASGGKPLAKALAQGETLVGNAAIFEAAFAGQARALLCFAADGSPRANVTVEEEKAVEARLSPNQ